MNFPMYSVTQGSEKFQMIVLILNFRGGNKTFHLFPPGFMLYIKIHFLAMNFFSELHTYVVGIF